MATPTTKQEFIDYCLRTLGAPVLQINLDPQQVEDRLEEALEYMHERHFDFNQRALFAYRLTPLDIANRYINTTALGNAIGAQERTLSDGSTEMWPKATDIRTISKVFAPNASVGDYMFDLRYQLTLFDFFGLYYNQSGTPMGPIASYMESMSYVKLVNDVFNYPMSFTYTRTTDRLFLDTDFTKLQAEGYMMIEAYVEVDTDLYAKVWKDRIFQRYFTAMLKKQWGQNLIKFAGVPLPGGAQLNAAAILNEAISDLKELELMLTKTQELPVEPQIG
jgi:hypothetical protein